MNQTCIEILGDAVKTCQHVSIRPCYMLVATGTFKTSDSSAMFSNSKGCYFHAHQDSRLK